MRKVLASIGINIAAHYGQIEYVFAHFAVSQPPNRGKATGMVCAVGGFSAPKNQMRAEKNAQEITREANNQTRAFMPKRVRKNDLLITKCIAICARAIFHFECQQLNHFTHFHSCSNQFG